MPVLRPALRLRPSRRGMRAFAPLPANDRLGRAAADRRQSRPARRAALCAERPQGAGAARRRPARLHPECGALRSWLGLVGAGRQTWLHPALPGAGAGRTIPCSASTGSQAGDSQRGMGEAASIASMIAAVKAAHEVDGSRVFVTGLSAGGAMASVMLATYPELFAAGAIIAGVAYGCASGVAEAFDCMGGRARNSARELGAKVRRASSHKGPWPRVQIWHGGADTTVAPGNADAIALQWAQPARAEAEAGPRGRGRRLSAPHLARRGRRAGHRAVCDHRHGARHAARSRHRRGRIRRRPARICWTSG